MKSISYYGNADCGIFTHDSARAPHDQLVTVKRVKGDYTSFSVLSNILQNVKIVFFYGKTVQYKNTAFQQCPDKTYRY